MLLDWQDGMLRTSASRCSPCRPKAPIYEAQGRLVAAASPPIKDNALLQGIFTYKPVDYIKLGLKWMCSSASPRPSGAYSKR